MKGTCPNCGFSQKISSTERGNRIRIGLFKSTKKIGRPSKIDVIKLKEIFLKTGSINGTAKAYGISRWTVRRYCK